jgi:hypothetical protein
MRSYSSLRSLASNLSNFWGAPHIYLDCQFIFVQTAFTPGRRAVAPGAHPAAHRHGETINDEHVARSEHLLQRPRNPGHPIGKLMGPTIEARDADSFGPNAASVHHLDGPFVMVARIPDGDDGNRHNSELGTRARTPLRCLDCFIVVSITAKNVWSGDCDHTRGVGGRQCAIKVWFITDLSAWTIVCFASRNGSVSRSGSALVLATQTMCNGIASGRRNWNLSSSSTTSSLPRRPLTRLLSPDIHCLDSGSAFDLIARLRVCAGASALLMRAIPMTIAILTEVDPIGQG